MKVVFRQDYEDKGQPRRAGQVLEVSDDHAQDLIQKGVARRHEVGPTETKEEDPDQQGEEESTP